MFAKWFISKSKWFIYNGIIRFCLKDIGSLNIKHVFVKYVEHITPEEKIHGFSFKPLNMCYGRICHSQIVNTGCCIFNQRYSVLSLTSFRFTSEREKGKILLYFYMIQPIIKQKVRCHCLSIWYSPRLEYFCHHLFQHLSLGQSEKSKRPEVSPTPWKLFPKILPS